MKIDLPPVWLLIALGSAWALARMTVAGLGGGATRGAGLVLGLIGLALILWSMATLRAARTPVMPGKVPVRLVTTGPYAVSRNPIYLGMAVILGAAGLWLGAPFSLLMVPVFMAVISKRFILPEELRLAEAFGADYEGWKRHTGRWLRLSLHGGEIPLK
ncbi:MAG: isoprenylcysteine carboxylmethyltransferase family protein [Paracoccaceae bacterium]